MGRSTSEGNMQRLMKKGKRLLMLYASGPVSLKEGLMLVLNNLFVKASQELLSFVGSRSLYFLYTSQHKVYEVHKLFHSLSHSFPTVCFLSFPSNFVQSRIYLSFVKPLQNRSKTDAKLCPTLRAQASQSGVGIIAII